MEDIKEKMHKLIPVMMLHLDQIKAKLSKQPLWDEVIKNQEEIISELKKHFHWPEEIKVSSEE